MLRARAVFYRRILLHILAAGSSAGRQSGGTLSDRLAGLLAGAGILVFCIWLGLWFF